MKIDLIRHGMTAGNTEKRYIGRTDEPLCEAGRTAVRIVTPPDCDRLAVSPLLRCRQTARILYPDMEQQVIPDFRECDFGAFEGKNAVELSGDPAYQRWIETNGRGAFPGGDDPAAFKKRCCMAFVRLAASLPEERTLAIVAHGGTIMAVMERFALPKKGFYEWYVGNAQGYETDWDGVHLRVTGRIG